MFRFLLIVILFFPVLTFAEVHKCVVDGRVVYTESSCLSGESAYDSGRSSISVSGTRSVNAVRSSDDTFTLDGSLNGYPLTFMVDTGASKTSINGRVAYALGMRTCQTSGLRSSAGGVIGICSAKISSLVIGGFKFIDVVVDVVPTMPQDALLGGDLLNKFKVERNGSSMVLTR